MANKKVKFELTAIDKTKAAFDKVTKGLKTVGGAAAGAAKGVAGVGLAAGATATALALLVDRSFQAVDAIGKTSTQTGIATDTLQAFHLAARESGTTVEGANTALIKFARSIGDASRGLKTQKDIFNDLGVELKDNNGNLKDFDTLLVETAVGISNMADQSTRAAALAGLFGRQGVILTGAIKDLSQRGLQDFITRAKELGIVLSEKVIRRTEQFNDAVGVVKMQLGSFVNNITTAFLPVFEEMQEKIAEAIQSMIDSAGGMDKLGMSIANSIIDASASGIEAVGQLQFAFADFVANLEQLLPKAQISYGNFIADLLKATPALGNAFGTIADVMLRVKEAELDLSKAEKNIASEEFLEKTKKAADSLRGMKITADDLVDSVEGVSDGIKKTGNVFTDLLSPIQKYKQSLEDVNLSIENATVASMKKMEDTIMDGIKTGKLAFEDFANFVVEQLMRIAIQQMIIKPITSKFENFLDSFDGGGYTGMGARAGGVDGKGGFPAILHPNETVVDHSKGQGMGGATVNFNISTVDAAGFDQLLASRKGLITSIINNAMNNQGKMGIV
jgi:uncharacterized protein YoxC